jgi:hypothetical protein
MCATYSQFHALGVYRGPTVLKQACYRHRCKEVSFRSDSRSGAASTDQDVGQNAARQHLANRGWLEGTSKVTALSDLRGSMTASAHMLKLPGTLQSIFFGQDFIAAEPQHLLACVLLSSSADMDMQELPANRCHCTDEL